jgi:hypothetical protein
MERFVVHDVAVALELRQHRGSVIRGEAKDGDPAVFRVAAFPAVAVAAACSV